MVRLPDAAGQVRNAPVRAIRGFFAGIGQLLLAADRFRSEEAERERAGGDEHDPLTAVEPESAGHDQAAGQDPAAGPAAAAGRAASRGRDRAGRDGEPEEPRRFRSLDSTGNVRVLTPAEAAEVSPQPDAPPEADVSPESDVPGRAGVPAQAAVPAVPAARSAPGAPAAVAQGPRARRASAAPRAAGEHRAPAAAQAPAARASAAVQAPAAPDSLPVPGYDGLSLPSLRSRLRVLDAAQLRVLVDYERSNAKREDIVTMFERRIAKLESAGPDAT